MSNSPTFQIPPEVINPIIEAQVSTAVIAALGNTAWLTKECIRTVLDQKVDSSSGQPDRYNSSSSPSLLQWSLRQCIQAAVTKQLQAALVQHEDRIKELLSAELTKRNSPMVKSLIEGMTKAFTSEDTVKYRLTVSCHER